MPAQRFVVGRHAGTSQVFLVGATGVERLTGIYTDGRLDWGALNEDAVRLARALLVVLTGRQPPGAVGERLSAEVVAWLPADGFVLAENDLLASLDSADDPHDWPPRPTAIGVGVEAMTVLPSRADGQSPARTCARCPAGVLHHAA